MAWRHISYSIDDNLWERLPLHKKKANWLHQRTQNATAWNIYKRLMMNYAYRKHRRTIIKQPTVNITKTHTDRRKWRKKPKTKWKSVAKTTSNVTLPNWTHTFNYYGNFFVRAKTFSSARETIVAIFTFVFKNHSTVIEIHLCRSRLSIYAIEGIL